MTSKYGFKYSFNPTFQRRDQKGRGWISKGYYGLDQGPIVIMIENHRMGFLWELMTKCPLSFTVFVRRDSRAGGCNVCTVLPVLLEIKGAANES